MLGAIGRQAVSGRLPENTAPYPFFVVMSVLGLMAGALLLRAIWRRARVI